MGAEQATDIQSHRARRITRDVLGAILALLIGLVVAELAVRGFALVSSVGRRIASRDPLATVYEPYGTFGYRPRPGKVERFSNDTHTRYNRLGYRGPVVSVPKPAGTYRVVLLGGSTAAGYGANDDETIDAHLRRMLAALFPTTCIEVVNLAVGGYDSYQDYERMRVDGSRLSPDLVIIHSGINDVRNAQHPELGAPPDRRTLLWETAMEELRNDAGNRPGLWTLAKHYSYFLRLPGYLVELSGQRRTITVTRAATTYDAAVDYFETNVERTIDLATGAGAAVILSTPPSALSQRNKPTDPVEKSYWIRDAGTTEAYRLRLSERMQAISARARDAGRPVSYVSHQVPLDQFLDDAHLLGAGNETVAQVLAKAIAPHLRESLPRLSAKGAACGRS